MKDVPRDPKVSEMSSGSTVWTPWLRLLHSSRESDGSVVKFTKKHPPTPTNTHQHPPTPTNTHQHPPTPTNTHQHPPTPTNTHQHPPTPNNTQQHPTTPTTTTTTTQSSALKRDLSCVAFLVDTSSWWKLTAMGAPPHGGGGSDDCARGGDTSVCRSLVHWRKPTTTLRRRWGLNSTTLHGDRRPPVRGRGGES